MRILSEFFRKYTLKDWLIIVSLIIVYFVSGKLGLRLAFLNESVSPVWAPTGIAIAAFLLLGFRTWPAILIGAFLVNFTTTGGIITSLFIAAGNTLEGLIGAALSKRFIGKGNIFNKPGNIFKYLVFAGMFATAVSAYIGTTSLWLSGLTTWEEYSSVWFTWWFGDMGGAFLVAPFLILWVTDRQFPKNIYQAIEVTLAFLLLFWLAYGIFLQSSPELVIRTIIVFIFLPVFVWIAFRFGPRETSTALLILYIMAAIGTLQGTGPFVRETPTQSLLVIQIFMGIMFIGKMPLAASALQIKESEEKYKKLISTSPDAILVTDLTGIIQVIDEQVLRQYGFKSESEIVGKSGFMLVANEDLKKTQDALAEIIKNGKMSNIEYTSVRKDGSTFYTSANASLILNTRGRPEGVIIVARDVTKEKELDNAKSEFFALAAHKLRAPLSAIHWNIELMLSDKGSEALSETFKQKLSDIYKSNQQLVKLVKNLLDISKIDQGMLANEPEKVDVIKIIENVITDMRALADRKSVTITLKKESDIAPIFLDPNLFSEMIVNLISNAIKYNKEKGEVTILVADRTNNLYLEISDTGIGIPPEEKDKVFNKFYRTATAKQLDPEGVGVGLFMIKSYLENIGGKIWFESPTRNGPGTIFYIEIPKKRIL